MIVFFRGINRLVDRVEGGDFLAGEDPIVMLDDLNQFAVRQPFAMAIGTDFGFHAIIHQRGEGRLASRAPHKLICK